MTELSTSPAEGTWVIRGGGSIIAETNRARKLFRDDQPAELFFPLEDIGMAFLEARDPSDEADALGQIQRYDLTTPEATIIGAARGYTVPPAADLAEHITFDSQKVTVEQL